MIIIIYYTAVNVLLFLLMGTDKLLAKADRRRISESTLLLISLIGGGFGGLVGSILFRHKIRKHYFFVVFMLSIISHVIIIYNLVKHISGD